MKKCLLLFLTIFILASCGACGKTNEKNSKLENTSNSTNKSTASKTQAPTTLPTQTSSVIVTTAQTQVQTQVPIQSSTLAPTPIVTATPIPITKVYQNDNLSFKFEYNAKWSIFEKDAISEKFDYNNENLVNYLNPFIIYEEGATEANGGNSFNIVLAPATDVYNTEYVDTKYYDTNFVAMWDSMRAIYDSMGFENISLKSNEYKTIGGIDWVIFKYSCRIGTGQYNFYQAIHVKGKVLITCTYTFSWDVYPEQVAARGVIFNDILTSFKFI